jgi:hypothetical protein
MIGFDESPVAAEDLDIYCIGRLEVRWNKGVTVDV